jgi:Mrp family chromosome partitioning ATPase
MHALMSDLARESIVIVDAPPLLPVTDAAVLTRSADGALVVVTHGGTLDSELTTSLNHISTVHGRTLGIIFNRVRRSAAGGYHYGEYTQYEYAAETKPAPSGKRSARQPVPKS